MNVLSMKIYVVYIVRETRLVPGKHTGFGKRFMFYLE